MYRAATVRMGLETERVVNAPLDQVWQGLERAYSQIGIPTNLRDPAARTIGARGLRVRGTFADRPLSSLIDCGQIAGVATIEDTRDVEITLVTWLRPVDGGVRMRSVLQSTAREIFGNAAPRDCVSRGTLELALADSVVRPFQPAKVITAVTPAAAPGTPLPVSPALAREASPPRPPGPLWQTIGLGIIGGAAGVLIGEQLAYEREEDAADALEFVAPGVGASVLIPVGAHIGNNRAGSLLPSFLAASGVAVAAIVVSGVQEDTEFKAFNFVPPAQLVIATLIERWTARHNQDDRD